MFNSTYKGKLLRCYVPGLSSSFQTNYLRTTHSVTIPLNIICALASMVLNALVIIGVLRKRRLRTPSTILLTSLNLKDLFLVPTLQILTIYQSFIFIKTDIFCVKSRVFVAWLFIAVLYRGVALVSMVLISIDRCIAIRKPHLYRRAFTLTRVVISLAVLWMFGIFFSVTATFILSVRPSVYLLLIMYGVTVTFVFVFQMGVYTGLKKQRRRTADMRNSMRRQLTIERAATTVVLYVILALVVCHVPLLSMYIMKISTGKTYMVLVKPWMELLLYLNALANPLIWLKTNRKVRNAVMESLTAFRLYFLNSTPVQSVDATAAPSDRGLNLKSPYVRKETGLEGIHCNAMNP